MLIYEKNGNIFALAGVEVKRLFDSRSLGFVVHNEEILLRIWRLCDMLQRVRIK